MKLSDLNITKAAQDGVTVPIRLPDGTDSDSTLTVRGHDSAAFLDAARAFSRNDAELSKIQDPDKRTTERHEASLRLTASLVLGWTLEDDFSTAAVVELFKQAPYVRKQVDDVAADRRNFFKKPHGTC